MYTAKQANVLTLKVDFNIATERFYAWSKLFFNKTKNYMIIWSFFSFGHEMKLHLEDCWKKVHLTQKFCCILVVQCLCMAIVKRFLGLLLWTSGNRLRHFLLRVSFWTGYTSVQERRQGPRHNQLLPKRDPMRNSIGYYKSLCPCNTFLENLGVPVAVLTIAAR